MCVNLIQAAATRQSAELDRINSAVSDCFGNACIKCLYELKEMRETGVRVSKLDSAQESQKSGPNFACLGFC